MPLPHIVTIGAYGWSEADFFAALQKAKVDLFCDIRLRRGVRGHEYAFANSQHLQARLAELGIAYRHVQELAPTKDIRQMQFDADKATKTPIRQRSEIDDAFAESYRQNVLDKFPLSEFLTSLPSDVRTIAFFCVEHTPEACHRSLVAAKCAQLGAEVKHLV